MAKQLKNNCKQKRGYVTGPLFNKQPFMNDQASPHIAWYTSKSKKVKAPITDAYWDNTKQLLHSDYFIADLNTNDPAVAYELGVAWTINYLRNILTKNDLKETIKLLDKFQFPTKKIIGIASNNKKIHHYLIGGVTDQGEIVSSIDKAMDRIKKSYK